MSDRTEPRIPEQPIKIAQDLGRIAFVGTPNSGKTTLFNLLTGLRQKTANYPGVTVERKLGRCNLAGGSMQLTDLPGIYSLSPHSLDERVAVDVLLGRLGESEQPSAILAVVDATRLAQGLYLLRHLLELDQPVAVAVTMLDVARASGIDIDFEALERELPGVPVFPVVGTTGEGIDALRDGLRRLPELDPRPFHPSWPELSEAAVALASQHDLGRVEVERAIIDPGAELSDDVARQLGDRGTSDLDAVRERLFGDQPPLAEEARLGHRWARRITASVESRTPVLKRVGHRLANVLNRPIPATTLFLLVMLTVFQAVFAWATPVMDGIDAATGSLGGWIGERLGDGVLESFLVDGVIGGVGSVVIFLPQILILFLFIIVLEDSGFLARSAFLMDRPMRSLGLSGQSVIPLLSSFACAVPAVMATRVIPTRVNRLATILAAPFMTCSARLPIYALLIGAFVPDDRVGWFNLQGLVLFGLYLLGIIGGSITALLVNRLMARGESAGFAMSLPGLRWPNPRTVGIQLLQRAKVFLRRAGTVIFAVAVVIWALAYFPRSEPADMAMDSDAAAAEQMANSWLGRAGRVVEPVFRPLGWDWRVSSAVIAGFPAREVVVAVMGTLYAVGEEASEERLSERLKSARWPDGRLVFTLPMVLGLLIFYAWCLQCVATVAVIRRETNSWRWPAFSWVYMTALGYVGALVVFQVGTLATAG